METILNIILPIVYIIVGAALVWFLVELVITIKKVRTQALNTIEELEPTIHDVQAMVSDIQPVVKKVDPIMDRVTLTVDSVNLEMMRVDEILEDVSKITNTVTKTVDAVDNVTSAPVDIVSSMTKKIRSKFSPKYASDESVKAGEKSNSDAKTNPIVDFADATVDAAGEAFKEQRERNVARKEEQQVRTAAQEAKAEKMSAASASLTNQILDNANADD